MPARPDESGVPPAGAVDESDVAQHLLGFFYFYSCEFSCHREVVDIERGRRTLKTEKFGLGVKYDRLYGVSVCVCVVTCSVAIITLFSPSKGSTTAK